MKDLITVFKALSDETRLRILSVLLEKECCVCEIMQALDISQSRASRNLGILQNAGFLKTRREGLWVLYSVDWDTENRYATSLASLLKESPVNADVLKRDKARLKKAKRVGVACAQRKSKKQLAEDLRYPVADRSGYKFKK